MTNKEVENKLCYLCESSYKLSYTIDETSGYAKFCPFCGEESYKEEELDFEEETEFE